MEISNKKVGYVAIIGRPNSGKSTFVNALIDEKVSIVSPKAQTTQKSIRGIYNDEDSQIIFFDTPGVNEGKDEFFDHLKSRVVDSLNNADVILRFMDSTRQVGNEEEIIDSILKKVSKKVIVVRTKCDLSLCKLLGFNISSIDKSGFDLLLNEIKTNLQFGHLLYPDDYYTDQDYETRISETIREKIFLNYFEEVPYSIFVEVGEMEDKESILRIQAYIYTETDSQKLIIIGKGGQQLTKIGTEARLELEEIYGKKVFLALRVKTMPKWKKNKKLLKKLY